MSAVPQYTEESVCLEPTFQSALLYLVVCCQPADEIIPNTGTAVPDSGRETSYIIFEGVSRVLQQAYPRENVSDVEQWLLLLSLFPG